jgi:hypothetical protein
MSKKRGVSIGMAKYTELLAGIARIRLKESHAKAEVNRQKMLKSKAKVER